MPEWVGFAARSAHGSVDALSETLELRDPAREKVEEFPLFETKRTEVIS
jgi:hypothetical protein